MKKTLYAACLSAMICGTAQAQPQSQTTGNGSSLMLLNGPILSFPRHDSLYDYGGIPLGEAIPYQFEIMNAGNVALLIAGMKCESPNVTCKWPDKPVKPGKKAYVTVTYTAKGDIGSFVHDILLTTNAMPAPHPYIRIKGAIIPAGSGYVPPKKDQKNNVTIEVKNSDAVPGMR